VTDTLEEIGATHAPVLIALNKIDLLANPEEVLEVLAQYPNSQGISAKTRQGLSALLARIEGMLQSTRSTLELLIPYNRGDVVSLLHEQAIVQHETHQADGTRLEVHVPEHLRELVRPYQVEPAPG
jgi:GTP-binding protein HflX